MGNLSDRRNMARIASRFDFHNAKSLGQNFLTDEDIIQDIIEGSDIGPEDLVIEIGPGMGVLTEEECLQAAQVVAIELDTRLVPILTENLGGFDNFELINEDVMKVDINEIIARHREKAPGAVRIIGNLPYYITTPIMLKLLQEHVEAQSITIMIQKEVADRILAEAGSKAYGAITLAVDYYCTGRHIADAPRTAFYPAPKVDSTVIRLDLRPEPPVELLEEKAYFDVVKAGFGQRRKTLLNSLTGVRGLDKDKVRAALAAADIAENRRAETLTMQEFAALANEVVKLAGK